jgi:site-specific DNA recombinase
VVVKEEAERVRLIFRRYLQVSDINELMRDLRAKNIRTKAKTQSTTGKTRGGIPFGRGALSYFLRNRFFIGEVRYKGEVLPGEQPAIMDKSLFEVVQQKLSAHQSHKTLTRQRSDHLLKDLLFDNAGHRMIACQQGRGALPLLCLPAWLARRDPNSPAWIGVPGSGARYRTGDRLSSPKASH